MVDLSVIIVSWNVVDLLLACLKSLEGSAGSYTLEIIVVDSASSDTTVVQVQQEYPQVKLLPQAENLGFVRCNNIGLAAAQGRYMLLLNPDTEVIGDALATMVAYLDANPTVGIVGPHTLNTDGSTQSSRRRFPDVKLAFFESTWLQGYAPQKWLDDYYLTAPADDAILDADWVQGSALMARREVYEQIGGLDPLYIMFYEELDWCKRAKDAGWRVVYVGTAQITHHGGKSTDQVTANKHIYFNESKLRYFHKYYGVGVTIPLRIFLIVSYGFQLLQESIKSLLGSQRPMRQERIRTYWQVLRSGLRVRN
ncbi:MAG: glycosyltransferase family 2 protein [Anaerolineae bacterium]|nr:glycosyltransferase family 2 protein [Anaerolineae bacterium]